MLKYLKAETNKTFTENGAVAFKTTNSALLLMTLQKGEKARF